MKNIIKRSLSMLLVLCLMVAASANGLAAIAADSVSKVVAIAVIDQPGTNYKSGECLDLSDMVVRLTYSDGHAVIVAYDDFASYGITVNFTDGQTLTTDDNGKVITVTANGITANGAALKVTAPKDQITVSLVEVISDPTKMDYIAGEAFSSDGMTIRLTYSDDTSVSISAESFDEHNIEITPSDGTILSAEHHGDYIDILCDSTYYRSNSQLQINDKEDDTYDIWVNGEQFTSKNLTIACGDGTATYDPDTNTLTLDNAEISKTYQKNETYYGIYDDTFEILNIALVGDNIITIDKDKDNINGICAIDLACASGDNGAIISGDGSLDISLSGTELYSMGAISSYELYDLLIKDTTVNVTFSGEAQNINAIGMRSTIENSDVTITVEDMDVSVDSESNRQQRCEYVGLYGCDIIDSMITIDIGDISVVSDDSLWSFDIYGIRSSTEVTNSELTISIGDASLDIPDNAHTNGVSIYGTHGSNIYFIDSIVEVKTGKAHSSSAISSEGDTRITNSKVTAISGGGDSVEYSAALSGVRSMSGSEIVAISGDAIKGSYAFSSADSFILSDSTITTTSGKSINGGSTAFSGGVTVRNSEIIATANDASHNSYGIVGSITLESGTIIATAGNSTTRTSAGLYGNLTMTGGTLTATGKSATGSSGMSGGIIASGDVLIEGGKVTATSGAAPKSYGIFAKNITTDGAATEIKAEGSRDSSVKFGYGLYATELIYLNSGTVEAIGRDSGIAFDGAMCKIVSGKITAISDGMAFSNTPNIGSYQNPYVTVNTKANASGASVWNQSKYPSLSSTALKYVHIEPGDGTMLTFAITGGDKGTVQYSTDGRTTKLTAANGDSVKVSGDVILYVKPYSGNEVKTFKIGSSNGNISAAAGSGYTVNLSSSATATIAFDIAPEGDDTTTPSNPTTTPTNPTTPTTPTTPTQPTTPSKPSLIFADRLYGDTRYDTAIAISKEGWNKAETVIIANGENYPDALAGTVLSKALDAPILLVNGKTIDSKMLAEIKRLGADKVVILGGYSAVSKEIEETLIKSNTIISRIAGSNRNGTAADIALKVTDKSDVVFLVSNNGYADALSASSVAAIKGAPILYLNPDGSIPAETKEALAALGCKEAYIIGGAKAVDTSAEKALTVLNIKSTRISGADRYATSIAVFDKFSGIFDSGKASVATGAKFPDALAGAALAAKLNMPTLLTGSPASAALKNRIDALETETLYVFGGSNAIPDSVVSDLSA